MKVCIYKLCNHHNLILFKVVFQTHLRSSYAIIWHYSHYKYGKFGAHLTAGCTSFRDSNIKDIGHRSDATYALFPTFMYLIVIKKLFFYDTTLLALSRDGTLIVGEERLIRAP